jgi:hypothetical protein
LGALLADRLGGFGWALLVLGAGVHAWGMFDKHRTEEHMSRAEVRWGSLLYWLCWGLLTLGAVAVVGRLAGLI